MASFQKRKTGLLMFLLVGSLIAPATPAAAEPCVEQICLEPDPLLSILTTLYMTEGSKVGGCWPCGSINYDPDIEPNNSCATATQAPLADAGLGNGGLKASEGDTQDFTSIQVYKSEKVTASIYDTQAFGLGVYNPSCNLVAEAPWSPVDGRTIDFQATTSGRYLLRTHTNDPNAWAMYPIGFEIKPDDAAKNLDAGNNRTTALVLPDTDLTPPSTRSFTAAITGTRVYWDLGNPDSQLQVRTDYNDWYAFNIPTGQTTITLTPNCAGTTGDVKLRVEVPSQIPFLDAQIHEPLVNMGCSVKTVTFPAPLQTIYLQANLDGGVVGAGYEVQVSTTPSDTADSLLGHVFDCTTRATNFDVGCVGVPTRCSDLPIARGKCGEIEVIIY